MVDHEGRGLVDRLPGGCIDPLLTRVISEELPDEPRRRHARRQPLARLIESGAKPVALLVGSLLQPAEIDRHRLRLPEQPGECRRPERSIRVARGGGTLDSPEQPAVRFQGGDLDGGRAVDPRGESSHGPHERTGRRRRNRLQRLQRGVDCLGPLGQMCPPRLLGAAARGRTRGRSKTGPGSRCGEGGSTARSPPRLRRGRHSRRR